MELATAKAAIRSAMKIPAFIQAFKTPVLTFCLFLFAFLFFLLITPNITKPAYAAPGCNVNTTTTVTPGGTIEVYSWDMPSSTILVINPDAHPLGTIPSGTSTNQFEIPTDGSVPLGTYKAIATFIANCTGGTDYTGPGNPGTGQVKVIAPLCSFTFTPNPVDPSDSLTITVNGYAGDGFEAGLTGSGVPPPSPQTGTFTSSGTPLNFTAPEAPGTYTVYAKDTKWGNNCVVPGLGSNQLTVGTGGPTPTPPPGTGCNIVPASTAWKIDYSVSGNTVTFTFSDPSGGGATGNAGIIIEDDTTGNVAKDSGALGSAGSPITSWSWTLPDGSYCAAVFAIFNAVSEVVHFTVPSTEGDTCTSSALNWVNDFRCRAIGGGWFDSDVFTAGQTVTTLESFNFIVWGESPMNQRWASDTTKKTGALALTGNMVASLYSAPPASGVQYFAQKIHDLNPVTPAYAAAGGIGYQTLGPVQKIWIAFRNIAYVGFIIVFVIMGFMIMFRAHISPQAVATVQDSIPRLVIALILVTFSYAIAGFMIDIMFLTLNIAVQALVATKLINNADYIFKDNVFTVIWSNWGSVFKHVAFAVKDLIGQALDLPGGFVGDIVEKTLKWTGGGLAALILGIALLFIMFRIFLMLLMAYVMIILLTMFAPFFFLVQALPGNNGAKEWFRQMASNIAVFPTVALMFIFAGILGGIGNLTGGGTGGPAIQPAQIGQFPLIIGSLDSQAIGELIGIGFLLITPSAAEIVKNAFGSKGQGGPMGAFAPGAAAIGGAAGFLGNRVAQSRVGRAYSDISEHRGRAGAGRLTGYVVRDAAPADPAHPEYGISRGKLPH